jgi:hypothetical protein
MVSGYFFCQAIFFARLFFLPGYFFCLAISFAWLFLSPGYFFCPEFIFHNANKHNRMVILTNIMQNREESSQE